MAILIFTTDYKPAQGSGIANFTFFLAKFLKASGENIIILAPKVPGFQEFDATQPFPTYRFTNVLLWREFFCFLVLPFLIKKHNVKIILNMIWLPCAVISYLLQRFLQLSYYIIVYGADVVLKAHSHPSLKHRLRSSLIRLKRKIFTRAEHVFAISQYTKNLLLQHGVDENKASVLYPSCVSFENFNPFRDGSQIKKKICKKGEKMLLTVGRLDFYKGHDCLLKALSMIKQAIPPWHYVIVGKGPEEKNLIRLAASLNLTSHVTFHPAVPDEDLPFYYAACDVFLFPSLEMENAGEMEGFGIVLVEAMACQKPVISGISGGTREVVVQEETGILVDAKDTQALAAALKRMLCDEAFAQKMAENGYRRAKEVFDGEKIAKAFLNKIKKHP